MKNFLRSYNWMDQLYFVLEKNHQSNYLYFHGYQEASFLLSTMRFIEEASKKPNNAWASTWKRNYA